MIRCMYCKFQKYIEFKGYYCDKFGKRLKENENGIIYVLCKNSS